MPDNCTNRQSGSCHSGHFTYATAIVMNTSSTLSPPVFTFTGDCSPSGDKAETARQSAEELNAPPEAKPKRVEIEADEIVFKAGEATITMKKADGGIVEIHAPNLKLTGDNILSEASNNNTTAGKNVICEAISVADLLGKLVRVDGQCVRIS